MRPNDLATDLGTFQTDKAALGYLPTYQSIAETIGPSGRVCEVGVFQGGSLELWQALFPQGLVVGIDHDPLARWPQGTMQVVADQTDQTLPARLQEVTATFDLIVEDASHDGDASRRTWELLWPLVDAGGWYVIEDWMVGFPDWPGPGPSRPSMLACARSFLDCFKHPDGDVESVAYRYGMIILRKAGTAHGAH